MGHYLALWKGTTLKLATTTSRSDAQMQNYFSARPKMNCLYFLKKKAHIHENISEQQQRHRQ